MIGYACYIYKMYIKHDVLYLPSPFPHNDEPSIYNNYIEGPRCELILTKL